MLGNRLGQLADDFAGDRIGQIAKAQHSDHALVIVQDGQAADLTFFHQTDGVLEVLVFLTVNDALGHDVLHATNFLNKRMTSIQIR